MPRRIALEWFAQPCGWPVDAEPINYFVEQTMYHARNRARSAAAGFHTRQGKAVRHVRESDIRQGENGEAASEQMFGSTRQHHNHDSKLNRLSPKLLSFCRVLYRQR